MSAQIAQDLRAAAEVLRRDGWTQGRYVGGEGCRCLVGALTLALGGTDGERSVPSDNQPRLTAAADVISAHLGVSPIGWFDVIDWNDEDDRTADEVIAALEAAADAAEAKP